MSQTQDPRQNPLQDDEIALARVLRALPVGEPSAKVDAAILAAATDAVAAQARPRRAVKAAGWLPTWAIGTAAAAVLAIGVGTQLRPPVATDFEPSASAPAPAAAPAASDRMDIELRERRVEPTPTFPPPELQGAPQAGRAPPPPPPPPPAPVAAEPAPAADAPTAFPESPVAEEALAPAPVDAAPAELDTIDVTGSRLRNDPAARDRVRLSDAEANIADADRREEVRRRQAGEVPPLAQATDDALAAKAELPARQADLPALARAAPPAPPPAGPVVGGLARERAESEAAGGALAAASTPAPVAMAESAPAVADATADAAATQADASTGGRAAAGYDDNGGRDAGRAGDAPLPPVAEDARLAPDPWIARIRDRLRRGKRADALESLRLLRRDHPTWVLPADFAALR